jgi:hypothetical protein
MPEDPGLCFGFWLPVGSTGKTFPSQLTLANRSSPLILRSPALGEL